NHLVVGVDIAQEIHVARAVNFRGIALGNPLEFSYDEVGFRSLDRWIRDLLASYKLVGKIKIEIHKILIL
ncbi:MAG: transposase, partial [Paenibacillus sp.]|nr:transposase [Paenibacillus sp.]